MNTFMNLISFFLALGISFYRSMVFMLFFNWFIATTFGLPIIGYWVSFALIMTCSVLTIKGAHKSLMHYENKKIKTENKWTMDIANALGVFIVLNFALFIGWLIHLNIM